MTMRQLYVSIATAQRRNATPRHPCRGLSGQAGKIVSPGLMRCNNSPRSVRTGQSRLSAR
jgi:hypothetical protein